MQLLKLLLPRTRGFIWRAEIETSNKGPQIRVEVKTQLACSLHARNLHAAMPVQCSVIQHILLRQADVLFCSVMLPSQDTTC